MTIKSFISAGLTGLAALVGVAASDAIAEEVKVPTISVNSNKSCKDYPGYPEVNIVTGLINNYEKNAYHCRDGKPVGKQTRISDNMVIESYYDNKSFLDFIVLRLDNRPPKLDALKQLNNEEIVQYTLMLFKLDDEKGGFIIDGSALISCSTSRRITTQIDGVNYTMRGDLTKECEDKTWQLYFRDDDVEKFPIHNTKTKKLSADDLQNLRDALQEITKMEAKYGTKYLPQFINAEKLYNLAKKQFELENKK